MSVPAPIPQKIEKLVPRLASPHDGEVVATARAICRMLEGAGLDLHDLVSALRCPENSEPATWHEIAVWCRNQGQNRLSLKEFCFVSSMSDRLVMNGQPTEKQAKWLRDIYAGLRKEATH